MQSFMVDDCLMVQWKLFSLLNCYKSINDEVQQQQLMVQH